MEAAIEDWDLIRSQLKTINGPSDLVHRMELLLVQLIHINNEALDPRLFPLLFEMALEAAPLLHKISDMEAFILHLASHNGISPEISDWLNAYGDFVRKIPYSTQQWKQVAALKNIEQSECHDVSSLLRATPDHISEEVLVCVSELLPWIALTDVVNLDRIITIARELPAQFITALFIGPNPAYSLLSTSSRVRLCHDYQDIFEFECVGLLMSLQEYHTIPDGTFNFVVCLLRQFPILEDHFMTHFHPLLDDLTKKRLDSLLKS